MIEFILVCCCRCCCRCRRGVRFSNYAIKPGEDFFANRNVFIQTNAHSRQQITDSAHLLTSASKESNKDSQPINV